MQNLFFSKKIHTFSVKFLMLTLFAFLSGCGDGGAVPSAATATTTTTTAAPVATIQISAIPTTVKSDGSTTSTITLTAVSATNSTIAGATITLSTDTGLLSSQTVTTDTTGKATVTFASGAANKDNRTATITATAGTATASLPVQVVGSMLTLSVTGSTSLASNGTSPTTLTVLAKDAGGSPISGATVTLTQAGTGTVSLASTTGVTDSSGNFSVLVAGATAGTSTVNVAGVGATVSTSFTVSATTSTFGISQLTLNAGTPVVPTSPKTIAMKIGDVLTVQVAAPLPTTTVTFATTVGTWGNGLQVQDVVVTAGFATATLNTTYAGVANVQVVDLFNSSLNLSDTLTVGMTAKVADASWISLQATPTVLPKSVGSNLSFSNLIATVYDINNAPVGGAQVSFSIVPGSGTNSGETVSPVVVATASTTSTGLALGAAPTRFTAGTLSSGASGVQVRASVVGTAISTRASTAPQTTSSLDAAIVIGGTAGSVAFGQATKIGDLGQSSTFYTFPMSVLVADANGSPAPLGTVVNISARPIAWSTGSGCIPDATIGAVAGVGGVVYGSGDTTSTGTFYNEDINENLILDGTEDGTRTRYYAGNAAAPAGSIDNKITPLNSYGGTVASTKSSDLPGTATTDAFGLATFTLTYTKSSAIWVVTRIRAQAVVQGTPAVGELNWRLEASKADADPTCYLPPSPFNF